MKNQKILKDSLIIGAGSIFTKISQFVLVIIYSYFVSVEDYGIIDMISSIITLLSFILAFNISESIFRYIIEDKSDENIKKYFTNGLFIYIVSGLLFIPILLILNKYDIIKKFAFLIYILLFLNVGYNIIYIFLKATEKLKKYTIFGILFGGLSLVFGLLLVGIFKLGVYGYLLSLIASYFALLALSIFFVDYKNCFSIKKINFSVIKEMLKYSMPLILNSITWWLINLSDRVVILNYLGENANGIISMAHKIPSIMTILYSVFIQAYQISSFSEKDISIYEEYSNKIMHLIMFVLTFCSLGVCVFIEPFTKIFIDADYYDSWRYATIFSFGLIFYCLSSFYGISYDMKKKNFRCMISTLIGGILNVLLCIILIKKIGLFASPVSTLVSYFVVFIYRYIGSQKYAKVRIKFENFIGLIFIMISILLSFVIKNPNIILIMNICLLILYLVINNKKIRAIMNWRK